MTSSGYELVYCLLLTIFELSDQKYVLCGALNIGLHCSCSGTEDFVWSLGTCFIILLCDSQKGSPRRIWCRNTCQFKFSYSVQATKYWVSTVSCDTASFRTWAIIFHGNTV